jgi:hypothetical protein
LDIAVQDGKAYVMGNTVSPDYPTTRGAFDTTLNDSQDAFVTKLNARGSALDYSTLLGGTDFEEGLGIAVGERGRAYVTGRTESADYPTTPGAFDTSLSGSPNAFVTKLNARGSALVYSTFLGGTNQDYGQDIAVGESGRAYVTGITRSPDFPTTPGAFDTTLNGDDVFVTKFNARGSALVYSTFLGGRDDPEVNPGEVGTGIAVDGRDRAYVTGFTTAPDYPTTPGAFDRTFSGVDAFVTKLNARGSALVYSTFLGGAGSELSFGDIAVRDGKAYVTGNTVSPDFPTTPGAFDRTFNGGDAFVTKFNASGSALDYSTLLGGTDFEEGLGIAVNRRGRAYVTGLTLSADYPTTRGAFDRTFNGGRNREDAFVTKLNARGSALDYSTFLGGADDDLGFGIAVDARGKAYVTGITDSPDYPTTRGAFDTTFNDSQDAFVTKLPIG